jgi:hypothetical protein
MRKAIQGLVVSMVAAVLLSACASQPTEEINAAKGAIDAVVSDGAEKYTPDQLQSINRKLDEAMAEIKKQDSYTFSNYSLAKFTLAQVKEDAEALKVKLAQRKEELKTAADTALAEARAAVAEAKSMLEAAPQGKGSLADIQAMNGDVAGLETELEAVAPQIDAGEYIEATEKAHAVAAQALTISNEIKVAQEKLAVVNKKQ